MLRHDLLDVSDGALFNGLSNDSARRRSADPAVALAPPRGGQVDPVEDQGQVGDGQFDPRGARELSGARRGLHPLEATDLKSLVPDHQPVTVKIEDLDPISASVEEEEEAPDLTPLCWQTFSRWIQRRLRSRTRGRCWNWPSGATDNEPYNTEEPHHV